MSLASDLLRAAEVRRRRITVGGVELQVRELNALEFARYGELAQKARKSGKPDRNAAAFLLVSCVETLEGAPAFTQEEADTLAGGSVRVVMPLVSAVIDLSELADTEAEEKKD